LGKKDSAIVWDSELKGFGLRVSAGMILSYLLDYRVNGRQHRFAIGRHPEWTADAARAEAAELKVKIGRGFDPLEQKQRAATEPTVLDLCKDYIERHCKVNNRPGSLRNNVQMVQGVVLPRLGKLRLSAVSRRDVEALHASMKSTPYRANRCLSLLKHMFNVACRWEWLAKNPAAGVQRYAEDKRERWLSADELAAFTAALDAYAEQNRSGADALRLLLLTGSRAGEVMKASWEQFDLERGLWVKPSAHTKEKKIEHVPLSEEALAILRAMKPDGAVGPIFPGRKAGSRVSLKRPWTQVCKLAGLVDTIEKQGKRHTITKYRPTLRLHDLRHNFASYCISNGASLASIGKLLGHSTTQTTSRYAHLADAPQREAANIFGRIFAASKLEGANGASGK
jgi:integrase